MKTLHYFNFAFVTLTLLIYIIYGQQALTAQFFLGFFQLIVAAIFTLLFKKFHPNQTNKLFYYWMSVIIWLLLTISLNSQDLEYFQLAFIIIIPMGIAIFFVYITHLFSLKNKKYEP